MLKRENYLTIVEAHVKNPGLVKHALSVEAAMQALADKLGGNRIQWGNLGLIHDADWEETEVNPAQHAKLTAQWLREAGETDEVLLQALLTHNYQHNGYRAPESQLEWALYTVDELTGLIIATALVKNKELTSVSVQSVLKKFPQAAFARGVNREQIKLCEEKLGIKLEDFVALTLNALQGIHQELGLK